MQINFQTPGQWAELNERLTDEVPGLAANFEVRAYPSVGAGLIEIVWGLSKMYPLKKKIAYIKDQDPYFEYPLTLLAREGYQLIAISLEDLKTPEKITAQLDRETLLFLYSVTDPILGILWPIQAVEQAIKDSSFQKIRVNHLGYHVGASGEQDNASASATQVNASTLNMQDRNTSAIYALPSGKAFVVAGERAKLTGLVTQSISWNREEVLNEISLAVKTKAPEDKEKVLAFEKRSISGSKSLFAELSQQNEQKAPVSERVYDRAVLFWADMDGHAIQDRLKSALHLNSNSGFNSGSDSGSNLQQIETASLSRWGGVRTVDWLKLYGLTAEMIRGSLILDLSLINDKLVQTLDKVCAQIRREQNGEE